MTRWAYLDHEGPIPFAHRGGASDCPENTMRAFENAVELGYRYVETDVHTTSDGVLVAFHDDHLDRVTDKRGKICDLDWSVVGKARVAGEGIPLLEDILTAWPDVMVNIDPKHDESVAPLVEVLDRCKAHDRVCVAAFSDRRLARFRALTGGRVCTAIGPRDIARLRAGSFGIPCGSFAAACTQVPIRHGRWLVTDPRYVAAAHKAGLPVHVWTIDDPAEMERLLDMGVDGIMTDRPAVLKDVLGRRGLWN
ncbi:MAG TPA: glycerophosphodiester phosphodiesterase [Acidimicrobiales bacterium]|nr:glycerophosphodiester phosphodiesterase [Acidimicrobiales bacterium]